jgi:hypothetical protein
VRRNKKNKLLCEQEKEKKEKERVADNGSLWTLSTRQDNPFSKLHSLPSILNPPAFLPLNLISTLRPAFRFPHFFLPYSI